MLLKLLSRRPLPFPVRGLLRAPARLGCRDSNPNFLIQSWGCRRETGARFPAPVLVFLS